MAFNQLTKNGEYISEGQLALISMEIRKGKYIFKPLSSYKIPIKSVKLNKGMVQKYLKNFSTKEKMKFFKEMREQKRHTRVVTEYKHIFKESLECKIVGKAIHLVLNNIIKEKNYFSFNMFAHQDHKSSIDIIDYLKKKVNKSGLTFMIQASLKNFFPSIKKKYLMKGFAELVGTKDNKFYHLLKSYFQCGYIIKVLSKSKHIGARRVKIILKNKSKDFVYQGTVLAPMFSNIINNFIIKEINKKIEDYFTFGQKPIANKLINRLSNLKFGGVIDTVEYKQVIKKTKLTCFTNDYKRAWFLNYSEDILILGHLSKKNRDSL